jgi:hypothetical protein
MRTVFRHALVLFAVGAMSVPLARAERDPGPRGIEARPERPIERPSSGESRGVERAAKGDLRSEAPPADRRPAMGALKQIATETKQTQADLEKLAPRAPQPKSVPSPVASPTPAKQ